MLIQDAAVELLDALSSSISKLSFKVLKLKRKIKPDPDPPSKYPIYTMGSADPRGFARGYNSFSGVDMRVYIPPTGEEVTVDSQYVSTVQGVKLWNDNGQQQRGEMTLIVFDTLEEVEALCGQKRQLHMVAADESGKLHILVNKAIRFDRYYNWEITVDSLVSEISLGFFVIEDKRMQ